MSPGALTFAARLRARVAPGLLLPLSLLAAPVLPGADAGGGLAARITQELRSFGTTGAVLHIGAHPDDENTQLITCLSLGRGYRTAYLSLTRGDGGQNELGKDFDEKLGVLRTQELLAARQFDHGRQFFTRAVDFGYSKSPEETLRIWNREAVLGDVVRVIRQFQPDVIVTRFPVPPGSGGHGHHTASAMLAVEAFKLAADPNAYPGQLKEGLTVWQARRVVWNVFSFGGIGAHGLGGPTVKLDIAGTDPVSGETFGTIANRSRGMHKTQGLGAYSSRTATGPNVQTFMLLAGLPGDWPGQTPAGQQAETVNADLMEGVDTTWNRVRDGAEIGQLAAAALAQFKAQAPDASVPALLAIRARLAALSTTPLIADKRAQLDHILAECLGLSVETIAAQAEVVPGEKLPLRLAVTKTSSFPVVWLGAGFPGLPDRAQVRLERNLAAGIPSPLESEITVPAAWPPSQPYWLRKDGTAGIFQVDNPADIGRPENLPDFQVYYQFEIGGQRLFLESEPVQIVAGAPAAQARRRVVVIPPVSLGFASAVCLIAPGTTKSVSVEITAARANTAGTLQLAAPDGWSVAPAAANFRLAGGGDKLRVTFNVTARARASSGRLTAVAEVAGRRYSNQRDELRYDHLPVQLLQPPARARLVSIPLATKAATVGYLPGAGDSVAECIAQMGCIVRPLTGADLTPARLQGLDAVVIGVRAFNERDDLKDAFPGLLAWVGAGGTVIAQYNRPNGLKTAQLGPYPLSIEGPAPDLRVTDENSPVTLLAPDSAALNFPNRITAADFAGWVQERGAYFPGSWDDRYTALLAMNDPGEAPLQGSLLVARYGKGHYVYTGLGFFRQLPAGVPGAYRLLANLLALGKQ